MTREFKKRFLWAKPTTISERIVNSIDKKNDEVYAPSVWFGIMCIVKNIPNRIFKRIGGIL